MPPETRVLRHTPPSFARYVAPAPPAQRAARCDGAALALAVGAAVHRQFLMNIAPSRQRSGADDNFSKLWQGATNGNSPCVGRGLDRG